MNTLLKQKKTLIITLCSLILFLIICIACILFWKYSKANSPTSNTTDYATINKDTSISVKNGILEVTRTEKSNEPMGEDGTWTILMYVCGSNLEEQYMSATNDFKEIMAANFNNDNLKKLLSLFKQVVVESGILIILTLIIYTPNFFILFFSRIGQSEITFFILH